MTATPTPVNGVDLESIGALASRIQTEPSTAATVWQARVTWTGGFRSQAHIRDFEPLMSDEPAGLGGSDTAPNPVEQLLAALGNCLAVGYAANASAAGITIDDLHINLSGDLDLRTFLGLHDGNAGYEAIQVSVELSSDASQAQLKELHERVVGTSPVGHTLGRAVPLRIELASAN